MTGRPHAALPRHLQAEVAARALHQGDWEPARHLLAHAGWRCALDPALADRLLTWLCHHPPRPDTRAWAVLEDESPLLGRPEAWPSAPGTPLGAPVAVLTCALSTLAMLGAQVEHQDRHLWATRWAQIDRHEARDAATHRMWAAWPTAPFSIMAAWEKAFAPDAAAAFLAIAEERGARPDLRRELAEGFFFRCLEPATSTPVWRRIYARVLESGPGGPIAALTRHIPDGAWPALALAMVSQGTRAATARVALPGLEGVRVRAEAVAARCRADVGGLEALLDLHVALRLLETWQDPEAWAPEASWRVVAQNRGRARGRLRAVLASLPTPPPLDPHGLHAATRFAVRRFFHDLALEQRGLGFSLGTTPSVDPPCTLNAPPETLGAEAERMLRAFVLRGVLLGHLPHLRTWVSTRQAEGRTAFYRYLEDLPAVLVVPQPGDRAGREGVRAALYRQLETLLEALIPVLRTLTALPPVGLAAAIRQTLLPHWHSAVPLPSGRTHTFIAHAAAALRSLEVEAP